MPLAKRPIPAAVLVCYEERMRHFKRPLAAAFVLMTSALLYACPTPPPCIPRLCGTTTDTPPDDDDSDPDEGSGDGSAGDDGSGADDGSAGGSAGGVMPATTGTSDADGSSGDLEGSGEPGVTG